MDKTDQISTLVTQENTTVIQHYSLNGELRSEKDLLPEPLSLNTTNFTNSFFLRNNNYYFVNQDRLFKQSLNGAYKVIPLSGLARFFYAAPPFTAVRLIVNTNEGNQYFKVQYGELQKIGLPFAPHLDLIDCAFIPYSGLLLASRDQAEFYRIKDYNKPPVLVGKLQTSGKILAVSGTDERNQCAVITEEGRVIRYRL